MKTNEIVKKICYLTIIFAAIMNFLLPVFRIPSIVKGGLAIIDLLLLIYIIFNFKKLLNMKYINKLLIASLILFLITIIGFAINKYSIILFIIGFRNTFRFFIFFFALCLIMEKEDIYTIVKTEHILFIINIIVALIEFFCFKYKGDFLSGTFAFGSKGGNAGLIALFTLELCILFNCVLSNKISIKNFVAIIALILGISALAELKIIFVLFAIMLFVSILINKKNKKTYYVLGIGAISITLGILVLVNVFPEWKDYISISKIYDNIFGEGFGYSSKYDISRGRAFNQIDNMFYKDEPTKKMFGFGIGNCESSKTLNIESSFYKKYGEKLHYTWFTHSMIYLETGLIGFIVYFSFFIINAINSFQMLRRYNGTGKIRMYIFSSFCFSLFCIISIFYDSFLRINYVYFASAFISIPYIYYKSILDTSVDKKYFNYNKNNKKIGIMSMQRIVNYGSFLQAFGLKRIIESLGYNVEFVDYKIGKSLVNNISYKNKIYNKFKNLLSLPIYVKRKLFNDNLNNKYNDSIFEYLGVSDERNYPYDKIDELVIGSDEVFNCLQGYPVCYSKELFGDNYNITTISYAACFGNTNIKDLKKYKIDKEIGKLLKRFKSISVRDENSYEIIKKLTKKDAVINLDPVLIYDYQNDIINSVKISNYILLYAYASRLTDEEKKYIIKFAKHNNKKIVSIGSFQEIADYNLVVNPFEVFAYFKNADFIITDTFHGSIFSIKMHSKFCTIIRNGNAGNSNKLYDLLFRLKRTDRIINKIEDLNALYNKNIDYKETDNIIEKGKNNALKYLKDNLL